MIVVSSCSIILVHLEIEQGVQHCGSHNYLHDKVASAASDNGLAFNFGKRFFKFTE